MAEIVECKDFNCEHNDNFQCALEKVRMVVIENELYCEDGTKRTNANVIYLDEE